MADLPLNVLFKDQGAKSGLSEVAGAADKAAAAAEKLAAASRQLAIAEAKAADAAGAVKVAEAKLQEVRGKANATASQRVAAEEKLAAANRKLALAQRGVEIASVGVANAQHAASAGLKQAAGSADQAKAKLGGLRGMLTTVASIGVSASGKLAGGLRVVGTGAASVAPALGLAAGAATAFGLKVASGNEQAKISFTTMLGSAQKAQVFLKQLQAFAAATPFEFPELQSAASSLISVGIDAAKIIPIMKTLGDTTAGMGTGSEGIKRATIALQQMNAAGRITAEDLNQLRDAGIPVFDLLSAATHKTTAEIAAMAQNGKLGRVELEQLMTALESGKGLEKFNGLMEQQSHSLQGMVSTLKDTTGQLLAGWLTPLFPAIKASIDGFNDMSSGAKGAIAVVVGGGAAFGLAAKGALSLASGFRAVGLSASAAKIAVGGVGAVVGVAAIAFGVYAKAHAEAKQRTADFTQALQSETSEVQKNVTAVAAKQLQDAGAFRAAQQLGIGLDLVTAASLGNADAQRQVNAALAPTLALEENHTRALTGQQAVTQGNVDAAKLLAGAVGQTGGAYNKATSDARDMEAATSGAASTLSGAGKKAKTAAEQLQEWRDALRKAARAAIGLSDSAVAYEQAIDDASAAAKKNGKTLDINTEKGRANRTALNRLASAALDHVQAMAEQGKGTKKVSAATADARSEFIRVAKSMGMGSVEAKKLADKYGLVPKKVKTDVSAPGLDSTRNRVAALNRQYANIPEHIRTTIVQAIITRGTTRKTAYGGPIHRDEGGPVPGHSPHIRADNIPAYLTAGEYVHQVPAVRFWGGGFMDAVNRMDRAAAARLMPGPRGGGDTYITINAPNYVGSHNELRRTLVDMNRRGELDVVLRSR